MCGLNCFEVKTAAWLCPYSVRFFLRDSWEVFLVETGGHHFP